MTTFKPKDRVIRIISTPSGDTGSIHVIDRLNKRDKSVRCQGDDSLCYDANTGREINPAPGFMAAGISSRIIICETGE